MPIAAADQSISSQIRDPSLIPASVDEKVRVPNLQETSSALSGHGNNVAAVVPVPRRLAVGFQLHGTRLDLGNRSRSAYSYLVEWI